MEIQVPSADVQEAIAENHVADEAVSADDADQVANTEDQLVAAMDGITLKDPPT